MFLGIVSWHSFEDNFNVRMFIFPEKITHTRYVLIIE